MKNQNKKISFIIPAYNCANTIQESIKSIMQGNFEDGDELIIVDDKSTDNTIDVLNSYKEKFPDIIIINHKINKGTAAASRNTGIENAKNELIFCLDSDNILQPNSILRLKNYLLDQDADIAAFGEIWFFKEGPEKITHKWVFRNEVSLADALAGPYWPGPSGNYMFTKNSWYSAGRYFEPTIENQTLDSWTFGIRQLGTGHKMVTLPGSGYYHRYGHNSHYIRNEGLSNQSLAGLIGLIPFLDQITKEDVDYIFSESGRYAWYKNLQNKPLHLKNGNIGKTGTLVHSKSNFSYRELFVWKFKRMLKLLKIFHLRKD